MTITRYILLTALACTPLTAWGQVFTSSRPGMVDGTASGPQARIGLETIANPRFSEGPADQPQLDPRILLMQGAAAFDAMSPLPPPAIQQQPFPSAIMPTVAQHYRSPVYQTSVKGGCFGIMGAVTQPGVYFHKHQHVTLGELLKLAGGSTSAASGGVRIVRQGRGGLQTFLTPDSQHEIMNGDVVLLESPRAHSHSGVREYPNRAAAGETAPAAAATSTASATAYLAFVNLLSHPIIVPVPSDQATLISVMKWLHQDLESPPFVRVLPPSPVLRQNTGRPIEQQLLESGTVLVFDPATIKRDRLPAFPPVIGHISTDSAPPQASETRDPVQVPSAPDRQPSTQTEQRSVPVTKPLRAPAPPTTQYNHRSEDLPQIGQTNPNGAPSLEPEAVPYQGGPQTGGPLLMMPQTNRPLRSQATVPESNSRHPLPPKRLESQREHDATPAHYEGQPTSWQSRPPAHSRAGEAPADDLGIIQAHGEQGRAGDEFFAGPALQLPPPVPQLVPSESRSPSSLATASASKYGPQTASSTFSMRIVWFCLGAMLLLVAVLWCVARWDGPRPVRAAVMAGHSSRFKTLSPLADQPAARQSGLNYLKRTDKTLAEAPLPVTPVAPATSQPTRVKPSVPAPASSPGSVRTISVEEQRLRAHFRETRQARVVEVPELNPLPTGSVPIATSAPAALSPAELRQLAGQAALASGKLPAQLSSSPKPTQPALDRNIVSSGSVLDRVLRAQQKR